MKALVPSLLVGALLAACTSVTRLPLVNAPGAPAAEGSVDTSIGPNGNTELAIAVRHLAPPERVIPGAKAYVVWAQPRGGPAQNIGAIVLDQNLSGNLDTVTPLATFELFITAEPYPTVTSPRGPRVLSGIVEQ